MAATTVTWRSVRETVEFSIDGDRVSGSASFSVATVQGPRSVEGSFEISC